MGLCRKESRSWSYNSERKRNSVERHFFKLRSRKEHDILSAGVTGIAVICLIIGTVFIFLIRKNFDGGSVYEKVYVGLAAMVAGGCGALAAAAGALGLILDLADNA